MARRSSICASVAAKLRHEQRPAVQKLQDAAANGVAQRGEDLVQVGLCYFGAGRGRSQSAGARQANAGTEPRPQSSNAAPTFQTEEAVLRLAPAAPVTSLASSLSSHPQ